MSDKWGAIPQELRSLAQWIVWKNEETISGKPTKVPYSAKTGKLASVTDASTWAGFDEATRNASWGFNGIGFVFTKNDDYSGIDLDDTSDKPLENNERQKIIDRQMKVYHEFNSYSEISPSGKGLHIIVKGKVPAGRRRALIEVYSDGRFFTMTGDVYNDKPIEERQSLLNILWEQIGGAKAPQYQIEDGKETYKDTEIIAQALNAANGDKFKKLVEGKWADIYSSQSEADFAFCDIVAFYTQNRNQIIRLFRNSILGLRDKAQRNDYVQYMLNKVFDRIPPSLDIEGIGNDVNEHLTKPGQHVAKVETPTPSPYMQPPGLLGDIAAFIYAAAPRQVPEIALAAAIGFLAGICGRAYNVSNTGLNQYVLLLAETGTGKEGMASGIDRIMDAIKTQIPASSQFRGPAQMASGQAVLKNLADRAPCYFSIIGEFGYRLQQLSSKNASQAELMLKQVLLDLYNKSGIKQTIQASIYAQKENNTGVIKAPAVTLLGESTPSTFYQAIDEAMIADGLLPRFLMIEYTGKRPYLNPHQSTAQPSFAMLDKLGILMDTCLKTMSVDGAVAHVSIVPDAQKIIDDFETFTTDEINANDTDIIRHLWNRAHIKLLKLSALVAVGVNPLQPIVTVENVNWAMGIIRHDVDNMLARFNSGMFGRNDGEVQQERDAKKALREYMGGRHDLATKYGVSPDMLKAKVIPYIYLSRRLGSMASFRNDRSGATSALKRVIQTLIDSGTVVEIGKTDLHKHFGTSMKAYALVRAKEI